MAYVQIDPVNCEEVVECFLSKAIFSLLINEVGRRASREEKIRLVIGDVLDAVLASGTPVFRARRVHGRTLFVEIAADKRNLVLPRMIQEVVAGHSERDWICFDRGKLLRAMPQLRKEYPEPNISGDPWFRVMKNLDDLDFEKIFPEAVRPSDGNRESAMLGTDQYRDISIAWKSDEQRSKRIAELKTALAAKDAELEQARAELVALREENAALKAELERARQKASPPVMTPQQKAAQARSEKALATWKPVIRTMIQIAVIIGKEGEKERQTPDLRVYFNEMDTTITDEQMKFFRQALPSEYKDSVGGTVGKI